MVRGKIHYAQGHRDTQGLSTFLVSLFAQNPHKLLDLDSTDLDRLCLKSEKMLPWQVEMLKGMSESSAGLLRPFSESSVDASMIFHNSVLTVWQNRNGI